MPIDFTKLGGADLFDTEVHPKVLFDLLPEKDKSRFKYPRDVQSEVMDQWFPRRSEPNITIKMNTGGGKTIVGLLLLKSCLNEAVGTAVYISPTPYLAEQVVAEAQSVGLEVTDNPRSPRFKNRKSILVTNIHKLINGKSVFGVGGEGIKIPIGAVVIDDAHACLETAEEQFSLTLKVGHPAYGGLLTLFKDDLARQSLTQLRDLELETPGKLMAVPYWAWVDKQDSVVAILHEYSKYKELEWAWPLICEHLRLCHCIFGEGGVEITPRCLPISTIPAFCAAARRIFMSATFSDNSVLLTDFDLPIDAVAKPITPSRANDLGDRMILVPQEFSPGLTDDNLKGIIVDLAVMRNVVVLVPSHRRAEFWEDDAKLTLTADNLADGVKQLKLGHVGLVVLVNKYDGIDLPDDACRVLVVDGIPNVRSKIDRIEEGQLWDSQWIHSRKIQRIEQGMGRGVRSVEDYCAVILMGSTLTSALYVGNAMTLFTSATRVQLQLAEKLAGQLEDATEEDVRKLIDTFLERDKKWVAVSRAALTSVKHEHAGVIDPIAKAQRAAFNAAVIADYKLAVSEIEGVANAEQSVRVKGWLKYDVAFYEHFRNPSQSQAILSSAVKLNNQLIRPLGGFEYSRLSPAASDQASACMNYLRETFADANSLILAANALADILRFEPETSEAFERAVADVGRMLGFSSSRPEADTGTGPDNLWCVGAMKFFVIECKNGATTNEISKHDCDQLGGSVRWFEQQYDKCSGVPVMIHPVNLFGHHGTAPTDTRVMTRETLDKFKGAFMQLASSLAKLDRFGPKDSVLQALTHHNFLPDLFLVAYTAKYRALK